MEIKQIETDVLVIGGGLAGLSAAIEAKTRGCRVTLISKGKSGHSGSSIMARNSMSAVLGDNPQGVASHITDTMVGGAGLNDKTLVEVLAKEAGDAVAWLQQQGVQFCSTSEGIVLKGTPGHSEPRILTAEAKGASLRTPGLGFTLPLYETAKALGVEFVDGILVTNLIKQEGRVVGAIGLAKATAQAWLITSKATVLACGGAGYLYSLTTNTSDVTGDGYALAHEAGAEVRDMEFVQFHPTVTLDSPKLVVDTKMFSDGAVLRNRDGEEFMFRYSPQGNMATRDVMARGIYSEIKAGRGTERGGVLLDLSAIPDLVMLRDHANILGYLRGKKQVEVAPAAHFMVGGVVIDELCQTNVPGLYACGEVTGGVHGANRLGGNALTEAVVFGRRAGQQAERKLENISSDLNLEDIVTSLTPQEQGLKDFAKPNTKEDSVFSSARQQLRQLMGECAGLVRTVGGLGSALRETGNLKREILKLRSQTYADLYSQNQVRLMFTTAELILRAAQQRTTSVGSHFIENSMF